jgi:hypothetical protein
MHSASERGGCGRCEPADRIAAIGLIHTPILHSKSTPIHGLFVDVLDCIFVLEWLINNPYNGFMTHQ